MSSHVTPLTPSQSEFLAKAGSPAALAMTVSRGRWKMAKHLSYLNQVLLAVAAGSVQRVLITMPPRHGKSELISKYFPAWFLGVSPESRVMMGTYETTFAGKLGGQVRDILAEWGQELFGITVAGTKNRWNIEGHEGGVIASGAGGGFTGEGADLFVVDDPIKNAEEALSETFRDRAWDWYQSTALTRLHPGGRVVLVQTRWHDDDLAGRALRHAENGGEPWHVVNMPAIAEQDEHWPDGTLFRHEGEALWPERYSLEMLDKMRRESSLYWWQAMYQQQPTQHGSAEWPDRYFDDDIWFDEWPDVRPLKSVLTLDPSKGKSSKKGDYSAFVYAALYDLDGKACLYVDADLERRPAEQIVADAIRLHRELAPDGFGCEANGFQELLASMIEKALREAGFPLERVYSITNTGDKLNRIRTLGPMLENGEIRFRRSPGCRLLVKQLKEFPLGKHDDGPDALEMAYQLLSRIVVRPTYERFVGKLVNVA